jgi:hypothetical protein
MFALFIVDAVGMEDMQMSDDNTTEFDIATANHIKLEANACGCVYTAKLVEEVMLTACKHIFALHVQYSFALFIKYTSL